MKTKRPSYTHGIHVVGWRTGISVILAAVLASPAASPADIPDPSARANIRIEGIYKVVSSNDPLFRVTETREYFLDFGRGFRRNRTSGSVAISLRQNPNVKVRIMAWQYFPAQETLLIGNPFAEGSRKAVAVGIWRIRGIAGGLVCDRGNHQVVLRRPGSGDY